MISTLDRIKSLDNSSLGTIEEQRDFVRDTLEVLRATSEITNDAFLDAGTIQGGLSLLLNLISQGISEDEASSQLEGLKSRARLLEDKYPGLDQKVETLRK
tara:strand:+ start:5425 stop:5727 length:303 start_codon:yes stop_codon:yes gene_type:complete